MTTTTATRPITLPSAPVLIGGVYLLSVLGTAAFYIGQILFTDVDPYQREGPVESMIATSLVCSVALALAVGIGFAFRGSRERDQVGAVVLAVLIVPMFDMRTWPSDAGAEPTSNTVRRAYDQVAESFGPGYNSTVLVAVDLNRVDRNVLPQLREQLDRIDGVKGVSPPQLSPREDAAILTVIPDYPSEDQRTPGLVQRVRSTAPDGAHVTGLTAIYSDVSDTLAANLWKVIAVVVGASLLLLMLMFRSVIVPLKAAAMNLLSIGAAYGVVTAVFQWGWGAELLGLPHAVPVSSFLPVLMFALLFALKVPVSSSA